MLSIIEMFSFITLWLFVGLCLRDNSYEAYLIEKYNIEYNHFNIFHFLVTALWPIYIIGCLLYFLKTNQKN